MKRLFNIIKKHTTGDSLYIAGFTFFVLIFGVFTINTNADPTAQKNIHTPAPTPTCLIPDQLLNDYTISSSKQFSNEYVKWIETLSDYSYRDHYTAFNPDLTLEAYVKNGDNESEVHLVNLDSQNDSIIYQIPVKTIKNLGKYEEAFEIKIEDIGFSGDGKFLAITTSEKLLTYDLQTKELKTEFYNPADAKANWPVYGYYEPVFSDDNNWVLVTLGYYEGSSQALLNRTSGQYKKLNYNIYGAGEIALGFYNNQLVVLKTNDAPTFGATPDNKIFLVNPDTLVEKKIYSTDKILKYYYTNIIDGNYIYFVIQQNITANEPNCENKPAQFDSLVQLNLQTGITNELMRIDSTKSNTGILTMSKIILNNQIRFVIVLDGQDGSRKYVLMDPLNTSQLTQISIQ